MDADHFDSLTKRLVAPTTRRATLGAVAAGSLLSALGLGRAAPEVGAAQGDACVLTFVANVRLGPSINQALTTGGSQPGELRGELSFALSESGNLEDGALRLPDGTRLPVVGQATGHALQVRIGLGERLALVAVGVGERELAACTGAIDGVVTGPEVGDLGDWHAVAQRGNGTPETNTAGAGSGRNTDRTSTGRSGDNGGGDRRTGAPAPPPVPSGSTGASGRCASGLTDCNGVCADLNIETANCGACGNVCESGLVAVACRQGVCERVDCPPGQTYCGAGDGCRDLSTDLSHCGRCQLHCAGGICSDGVCGPAGSMCPEGQADCGEGCTDLSGNDFHCGACGNECADGQVCQGGDCVGAQPICAAGLNSCNSVCVDFSSDPAHCGDCFIACATGQVCQGGVCTGGALQCMGGLTDCGGVCIDLQSDATNCGFCGNACSPGASCTGGGCTNDFPCTGGKKLCADSCVDTASDPANCGACGNDCAGYDCVSGVCSPIIAQLDCAALGLTNCGGICVDFNNDPTNCGACGFSCGLDSCRFGLCTEVVDQPSGFVLTCADSGLTDCGGVCVDLLNDNNNCGACGHPCYPGLCNNGNGTCSVCDPNNEPVTYSNCA